MGWREANNVQIVFIAFFKQENGLFVVLFRINRNAV